MACSTSFTFSGLLLTLMLVLMTSPVIEGDGAEAYDTWSSCTDKQIENCQKYAQEDKLNQLDGGGVCTPQTYVHYTHRCTVTDYRRSIDFCCCAIESKVMCCRYNQNWDFFRCAEPEDTIASLTARPIPLKILLPSILGPVAVILCCIFCCIKCYNHWASARKAREAQQARRERIEATAPPLEAEMFFASGSDQNSLELGEHLPLSEEAPPAYSLEDTNANTVSSPNGHQTPPGGQCPMCHAGVCAPPAYEESLTHPLMSQLSREGDIETSQDVLPDVVLERSGQNQNISSTEAEVSQTLPEDSSQTNCDKLQEPL